MQLGTSLFSSFLSCPFPVASPTLFVPTPVLKNYRLRRRLTVHGVESGRGRSPCFSVAYSMAFY